MSQDFNILDRKRVLTQLKRQVEIGAVGPDEHVIATYAIALGLDACADALLGIRDALKERKEQK